jgi:hypothetical protein
MENSNESCISYLIENFKKINITNCFGSDIISKIYDNIPEQLKKCDIFIENVKNAKNAKKTNDLIYNYKKSHHFISIAIPIKINNKNVKASDAIKAIIKNDNVGGYNRKFLNKNETLTLSSIESDPDPSWKCRYLNVMYAIFYVKKNKMTTNYDDYSKYFLLTTGEKNTIITINHEFTSSCALLKSPRCDFDQLFLQKNPLRCIINTENKTDLTCDVPDIEYTLFLACDDAIEKSTSFFQSEINQGISELNKIKNILNKWSALHKTKKNIEVFLLGTHKNASSISPIKNLPVEILEIIIKKAIEFTNLSTNKISEISEIKKISKEQQRKKLKFDIHYLFEFVDSVNK